MRALIMLLHTVEAESYIIVCNVDLADWRFADFRSQTLFKWKL